ncbi:hypothetical protein [Ornithinibacillus contaminans]|uniref:hypothetical protein n=1 Tax=Ornithinibacillus contaminans TaxID=694055 RepID=UPI00064DD46B|nr:hypothetical protein [Ornithinibacillus contaminans]
MIRKIVREVSIFLGGALFLMTSYSAFAYFRNDTIDIVENTLHAIFVVVFVRIALWLVKRNEKK